jgi:hypothetical protein
MKDWNAVNALLKPGAIVAFHDIKPESCGWMGPRYVLDRIAKDFSGQYGVVNHPSPEGYGVGLIQKLSGDRAWLEDPSFLSVVKEAVFNRTRWR